MTESEPSPPVPDTAAPASPATAPARRRIPLRKIILSIILACSVLYFFGILFAGIFAVVRAAAPHGSQPVSYSSAIIHAVLRRLAELYHRL